MRSIFDLIPLQLTTYNVGETLNDFPVTLTPASKLRG